MSAQGPLAVKVDINGNVNIDKEVKALISNILQTPIADRAPKMQALADLLNTSNQLWLAHENYRPEAAFILAQALANNHTITLLHLGYNYFENVGIRAISNMLTQNTTLKELHVQDNGLNDEGAYALAELLKHNNSLTNLTCSHNWITNTGGRALEYALAQNYTLNTINLNDNEMSPLQMERIKQTVEDKARIAVQPITYFYMGRVLAKKPVVSDVIATVTSFCTDNLESLQYARLGYLSGLPSDAPAEDLRKGFLRLTNSDSKVPVK